LPAPRSSGCEIPITCNSALEPEIELIVTEAAEVFESVSTRVLLLPTATVPKSRLALATTTLPPPPEPPADKLWHPARNNEHTTASNAPSQKPRH
jgi:hypothetical protein